MGAINTYPDDATTAADDKFLTLDNGGTTKLTSAETLRTYVLGTSSADYTNLSLAPNTVTYNGNRSYDLVFNAFDYSSTLTPGHRLKTTRTVAAPTRSTSLNGSSQYWNKTSPVGMTFTDDFVVSAWVKVSSYSTVDTAIVSRYNGTSGWWLGMSPSGQVELTAHNAGSGNFRRVISYQSLPLNKWVHVTAQLDMSAYTATATSCYIMIDGVDVPASLSQSGTNPTALVQAGNLEIGALNSGAAGFFFPGKIAQAFVSSAKITQANVRTLISQGLTSSLISTHSIVSAYSFDGVGTDLNTTNANNLTAQGAAVATNADSPFGTQASGSISANSDYALVQKVAFSTNTTVTVQVPEGCTIPTSGGVTTVSYSPLKAPFGFPVSADKWSIVTVLPPASGSIVTGSIASAWGAMTGTDHYVPAGKWKLAYSGIFTGSSSTPGGFGVQFQVDSSVVSVNKQNQSYIRVPHNTTNSFVVSHIIGTEIIDVPTATTYRLYAAMTGGSGTQTAYKEANGNGYFVYENLYL